MVISTSCWVGTIYEAGLEAARTLAVTLNLPLLPDIYSLKQSSKKATDACTRLLITPNGLALQYRSSNLIEVNFHRKNWQNRRDAGKKQGLIRACKPKVGMRIIDATAGFGKDAAILASFGANVTMLERHPIMYTLLEHALTHRDTMEAHPLSLCLVNTDAYTYLKKLEPEACPDVIYLDPMHPIRRKSAAVKKEMQALQSIIPPDDNIASLLDIAKQRVLSHVVLKWPAHEGSGLQPDRTVIGKTVRFEIFLSTMI